MFKTRDDLRGCDLERLNSVTKYPSIETYHPLNPQRGGVLPGSTPQAQFGVSDMVYITEKVDGANTRIILFKNTFLIASREELLYCDGDLVPNPVLGIVEAVRKVAYEAQTSLDVDGCVVLYGETFGGKVTKESKNYSTVGAFGFRLFDALTVNLPLMMDPALTPNQVALNRRDGWHGVWMSTSYLHTLAARIPGMEVVPNLGSMAAIDLPRDVEGMHAFLKTTLPQTRAAIDHTAKGKSEGFVVRTEDRTKIAKVRFEDYERMEFILKETALVIERAKKAAAK